MQWKEMGMPEVQEGQEVQEQLVKYIDEAYAMEQNVLRMLDGMIETSEDPEMRSALEEHKRETRIRPSG
jgi:ferritin-like metal-binding protein YciE